MTGERIPVSISEGDMKGLFEDEYVPALQHRGDPMIAVAAVSALLNVLLIVLLVYRRWFRQYREGLMGETQKRLTRPKFRRYVFQRDADVSGVSGTGHVCEVAEFSDGHAALHWLGKWPLTTPHPEGIKQIEQIHGHDGKSRLVPIDGSW